MRAERDRTFTKLLGWVVLFCAALLGAAYAGLQGVINGAALGLVFVLLLLWRNERQTERRRQALREPFPESSRAFLLERYDHFDRLPPEWRVRFEDDVRLFLADKRITGVEVEVTEELRLLVAASAVTLSLGWPEYEWEQLTEVLLYPRSFDRDYRFGGDWAGEAHPMGTVILSVPSLVRSFEDPDDGYHSGLHEFAHLLTLEGRRMDRIPAGLTSGRQREWALVMEKESDRLRRRDSVLDPYANTSSAELVPVAVEAFFEMPLELRDRHPELYAILAAYFAQDPAAWDDARGLTLS